MCAIHLLCPITYISIDRSCTSDSASLFMHLSCFFLARSIHRLPVCTVAPRSTLFLRSDLPPVPAQCKHHVPTLPYPTTGVTFGTPHVLQAKQFDQLSIHVVCCYYYYAKCQLKIKSTTDRSCYIYTGVSDVRFPCINHGHSMAIYSCRPTQAA